MRSTGKHRRFDCPPSVGQVVGIPNGEGWGFMSFSLSIGGTVMKL